MLPPRETLKLCRQHNDLYGQADTLNGLGAIASHTAQYAEAARHYHEALALWSELDNTYRQADTPAGLGPALAQLHDHEKARQAWRRAVDLYRAQGRDAEADRTERLLTGAAAPS